jgi:hypothetical protein
MEIKKTETLQVDEKDNFRVANRKGTSLCFKIGKNMVSLERDDVLTLIDHLNAWIETGDLEIPAEPEEPAP